MTPKRSFSPAAAACADGQPCSWPLGWVFATIGLVVLIAYFPALCGDFLWDDAGHVTAPALQSWSGLLRIWFEPGVTQQYYPLLHSAFWIEHQLWGDATLGYHLVNVLWHATSACLFVTILRRLAVPGALLAGLIFALHPVCVESVAWIAEQKNTLSTVFYLAATLAWLRFEDDRRPSRYAVAILWFVAALLTKTVTATLPAALLVVGWWRRGRLSWRNDVVPLLPWLVLGVTAGLGTAWVEAHDIGASGAEFSLGVTERVLLAGRIVWFYLSKLVWPAGLVFFYPRWTIDGAVWWQWLFPLAALAVLVAGAWWSRRNRGPLAAALLFGGTLVPVLGFVNVYPFVFSYVADHFQYLASLGMIAFLVAAGMQGFALLRWPSWSGPAVAAGLLVVLGVLTWRQSRMYRDQFSLYETTLARNPASWVAHLNLGTALDDVGRPGESLPHLQRALELKPDFPETLNSLGGVLNQLGRPKEAQPLLERAIQLRPRFAPAHNTLGVSLMSAGQADAGVASFKRALEIDPKLTKARVNLGWALANTGHQSEALVQLEQARREQPANADAEIKTALTCAMFGRTSDAAVHAGRAVELQPDNPNNRFVFGCLLLDLRRPTEAAEQFEEALQLAPNHVGARQGLDQARRLRMR